MSNGDGAPPGAAPVGSPASSLGRRLAQYLGIDRAIAYTIGQRAWSMLAAPITLLLISRFLTPEEQGFYYTFASVLGLQAVFELGFAFVLLQFTSHEMARLGWAPDGTVVGNPDAKAKLGAMLRVVLFWYGVVAALVVVAVLPAGLLFFGRRDAPDVDWHGPWVWVVVASAATLFLSPLFALLEGCGLVAEIALQRTAQSMLGNVMLWIALLAGFRLFAAPVLTTVVLACGVAWLLGRKRRFLRDLMVTRGGSLSWREEIWPFQWRIAVSTLSGYLIFQLFNPILFSYRGAVEAGRMGMSITIMSAMQGTALAWVSTKSAPFGALVARRDFVTLDHLFFASLWRSLAAVGVGGASFWLGAYALRLLGIPFADRILPPVPLAFLVLTAIVNHILAAEALYLRAHKREPFIGISVAIAVLVTGSSFVLAPRFGAAGMTVASFLINTLVGLGIGTWIFVTKRREWHEEGAVFGGAVPR